MGQKENTFIAIAKTGKGESCLEGGKGVGEEGGRQLPSPILSSSATPFPKPAVSFLSLWPKLCSNMKMWSDKGSMWCRHLGNSGDFFSQFKNVFWFKCNNILPNSSRAPLEPCIMAEAPMAREAICLSSRSTDAWGAFGQHLL